jgi:thioredoxin-related protein
MNKDFYFVELDAEEKKTITLNDYSFKHKKTGAHTGIHELAEQLATIDNTISYPTLCFLNEKYEIIYQQPDYVNAKQLLAILQLLSGRLDQRG